MDGRKFLDSGRHLLSAPSEANWRSAVGRGYFALLHEARTTLDRWGFSLPAEEDIHAFILSHVGCPYPELLRVEDALKRLDESRSEADYELFHPGRFTDGQDVTRLLTLAGLTIDLLDEMDADPVKRMEAIAMIRSVWP